MARIINLTMHRASPEQEADGVVEPGDRGAMQQLLNFAALPTYSDVRARADALAQAAQASGATAAMIGGATFLMGPLEDALRARGLRVLYAFSMRDSVETRLADGSMKKVQIFRHAGWIEAKSD